MLITNIPRKNLDIIIHDEIKSTSEMHEFQNHESV